ncbi:MAG: regulatory iron-sulfur-containing complex subunit RicT [Candidatus Buchananbacteria bacterium]
MRAAIVQFAPWDKPFAYDLNGIDVKSGVLVVVNSEYGQDAGIIIEIKEIDPKKEDWGFIGTIERTASRDDSDIFGANDNERIEAINYCRRVAKKNDLEMKIVDCHFSFDNQRLTFSFIADGRIDFRNLVKDLNRHFQKSIRLHQLGVRDEAKLKGDVGCCGLVQCCKGCLKRLGNVTSEYADIQQVAHRGSERLSGVCGRLKCCLAFENEAYQELAKSLPPVGTRVITKHGRGEVIGWHVLKSSVDVRIDADKEGDKNLIVEVPIEPKKQEPDNK